jgi:hypothetical protein
MPIRISAGKRSETRNHEQENSPEQMVDVETTSRHDIVERQKFVMNDVGKRTQEDKNDCERNQRTKRHAPAEAQFLIMVKKTWNRHLLTILSKILTDRSYSTLNSSLQKFHHTLSVFCWIGFEGLCVTSVVDKPQFLLPLQAFINDLAILGRYPLVRFSMDQENGT